MPSDTFKNVCVHGPYCISKRKYAVSKFMCGIKLELGTVIELGLGAAFKPELGTVIEPGLLASIYQRRVGDYFRREPL
jgi:hypothetical protein